MRDVFVAFFFFFFFFLFFVLRNKNGFLLSIQTVDKTSKLDQ